MAADLAVKLHAQGFNWSDFFRRWPLTEPTPNKQWTYMGHVVNNAMAVKARALWWRLTGDEADRTAVYDMIGKLDRYHGMVTGIFTGDECLAGKRPTQGTELCAVVEYAYSLEVLLSVLGDPIFGDRLEKIVFNALPATFSPDMWAHQYDQQVNQVECQHPARPSVEHQRAGRQHLRAGAELWLLHGQPEPGLAEVRRTSLDAHTGRRAGRGGLRAEPRRASWWTARRSTISLETDYPFRETLRFVVTAETPSAVPAAAADTGVGKQRHGCRLKASRIVEPAAGHVPPHRA